LPVLQMRSLLFCIMAMKLLTAHTTDFLPILCITSERGITLRSPFLFCTSPDAVLIY
jgi:hypothetical protein